MFSPCATLRIEGYLKAFSLIRTHMWSDYATLSQGHFRILIYLALLINLILPFRCLNYLNHHRRLLNKMNQQSIYFQFQAYLFFLNSQSKNYYYFLAGTLKTPCNKRSMFHITACLCRAIRNLDLLTSRGSNLSTCFKPVKIIYQFKLNLLASSAHCSINFFFISKKHKYLLWTEHLPAFSAMVLSSIKKIKFFPAEKASFGFVIFDPRSSKLRSDSILPLFEGLIGHFAWLISVDVAT